MFDPARMLAAAAVAIAHAEPVLAADSTVIPNFSPGSNVAWQSDTREGLAPSSIGPRPAEIDAAFFKDHPYDMDTDYPVMNAANPNLQPWVVDALKAQNAWVLSGQPLQPKTSSCWPHGLPAYMRYNGPTFLIQSENEVVIVKNQSSETRRVALNTPHSLRPKPSWYGESVGHYENGDTLVIDTIGLTDSTAVDLFRTPHTSDLHVIERWTLLEGVREIMLNVRVEDPAAFKEPYELVKHYRRVGAPWVEAICAENPIGPLGRIAQGLDPMPEAAKPDF